jgi:plastocyanin
MRSALIVLVVLVAGIAAADVCDVAGVARVGGRPQENAIVWLEASGGLPQLGEQKRYVLDQRNLAFFPHVLVVPVGATVEFPNNDRVFHNVFSFKDGKRFDLGLYPIGTVKHVRFDTPGLSRVFCNIHPAMAAYVMVVDTPYFAISDEKGRFMVRGVPAGSYTYRAWRPGGATLTDSVAIAPGSELEVRWP